jgi:hypothetical protein
VGSQATKLVGLNAHCGGFIATPSVCEPGLVCIASGIPDAGGVCVADSASLSLSLSASLSLSIQVATSSVPSPTSIVQTPSQNLKSGAIASAGSTALLLLLLASIL